jgi:integrase
MAERSYGTGSIRLRGDGRWEGALDLPAEDGKRKRKYVYGKSDREVERKLKKIESARDANLPIPPDNLSVAKFLTDWLASTAKPQLRETTYNSYEQHIRLYILPLLGLKKLNKLEPTDVQRLLDRMMNGDKPLSSRTALYSYSVLKRALQYALRWGMVSRNVATLVDAPRLRQREIIALDSTQARAFLAAVQGHRLQALYTLALGTGMRRGELLGLRWIDVDTEKGTLQIVQTIVPIGGKLRVNQTKNKGSARRIALPKTVVAALGEQRRQQEQDRERSGEQWREHGLVFTSQNGTAVEPTTINRHFKKTLTAAGLPAIRFHDLRHSAASILLAAGVPAQNVADLLGHSSIRVTLDIYGHIFDVSRHAVAATMDAALT